METESWTTYEEVAQYLINQFADAFSLGTVEAKQVVPGESGTNWEIDAKGIKADGEGFVIVECKRYTTSRVSQEIIAGLAYRIKDTGAKGGIVVSPLEFQKGARLVAEHEGVQHVILDPTSTTTEYILKFLNKIFVGLAEHITCTDSVHIQVYRDGNLIDERSSD